MKIAHLILVHKNPQQVMHLIETMQHPCFDFFIHVDKKADEEAFRKLSNNQIYFIKKRVSVFWAGYGTIEATLNGFRQILTGKYDYINVISGQDFPLKPADKIYSFIETNAGKEFITCESIENEWIEAAPRVKEYHFINWKIPGKYTFAKLYTKLMPARKFPLPYHIVGRANWFTITTIAAKYILDFLEKNPKVNQYFKYCWGADEFFFATILYNSDFKNAIEDNLVYVDWTGQTKGHPRILEKKDLNKLLLSNKLFARKFDVNVDPEIIDLLNQHLST